MGLVNRVSCASATRNEGCFKFWNNVFLRIGFSLGDSLSATLRDKDKNKARDNSEKGSIAGKRKRKTNFNEKIRELTITECKGIKAKKDYCSGMAIDLGADVAPEKVICTYYPLCLSNVEHKSAKSKVCDYNKATKEERKNALKGIKLMSRKGNIIKE